MSAGASGPNPFLQSGDPVLQDGNVQLVFLNESHISERYAAWFSDPEVTRETRHGAKRFSAEDLASYIRAVRSSDTAVFAILLKGRHVGNISLNDIDRNTGSAEISILIGEKDVWGEGAATTAVRLVCGLAFGSQGLSRVWMGTPVSNAGMIRVAEKCGFVREGTLRGAFVKNGNARDIAQFSMLNPQRRSGARPRFAVLMKYGNIVGLEYLKAFREAGIAPDGVIFKGDSFDQKDKRIVEERTAGKYKPLFTGDVLNGAGWPLYFVPDHNGPEAERILRALRPDALVMAGCDFIQPHILALAPLGTLNCHPGLIPDYRGCSNVEWALFNDDPVAATCHLATARYDHGPIVHQELMPVYKSDRYADVRARMIGHQARVMLAGLRKFLDQPTGRTAPESKGTYYKLIPPAELAAAQAKLENGLYRHAVEAADVV